MFRAMIGDLFASQAQTLVNTVNCVGVMGKGVALEFKKRFPRMAKDYADRCERKQVRLGKPYLYMDDTAAQIVNFPPRTIGVRPRGCRTSSTDSTFSPPTPSNGALRVWPCRHLAAAMVAWLGRKSGR